MSHRSEQSKTVIVDDDTDDNDIPGEDDVLGPGKHEDGRRVLAGLVMQLRGNLVTLPDLESLHRPQPGDDIPPEILIIRRM